MKTRGKLAAYNPVDTRSSPCSLVEALQQLNKSKGNEEKVRTLKYIGFGALLDLELKKQSLSLAAWLLDHFDPNKCSIEFSDGRSIKITDVDVHRCIGIPLGKKTLVLKGQNDNKDVLQRWRSQYDKQYSNLRPSHVTSALLRGVDGGLEFVQNFMVLFDTTLVNIQKSGGVSQRLVRNIDNVDAVKGINWREYVLSSLIKAKLKFGEERKGSFGGSLLFLVLLYLDRVVHQGQRQVPRVMPVFIGWNDIMVSTREKSEMLCGGFGKGRIEAAMDVEWIEDTSVTKEVEPQFEPAAADRFSYSPTTRKRSILFSQTLLRLLPKLIILTAFTLHGWKNCIKKENLCLYGFPNENWEVNLPAEEVPPELLEPA